jgi:hypothetical protein
MIKNEICCHAFITRPAANFHNALCLEADHRKYIENYSIFLEL